MNIEMKIEQHERYYRVIFTPDTNYGNLSYKVYTKKEAYKKYHEVKDLVNDSRPGRLTVFEYILEPDGNYREGYLCSCRVGKSVDTIAIASHINQELNQLTKIYNKFKNEEAAEKESANAMNMIHGIELADLTQLEDPMKVLELMKETTSVRRQAKYNIQDYQMIQNDLTKAKGCLASIERRLKEKLKYRQSNCMYSSDKTNKDFYLECIGLQQDNNECEGEE
jgi:hypothetical protein